jgi:hypothetical protein
MSYKFLFIGGSNNSYFFETKDGVVYEVNFKPTPYLFGEEKTKLSEYIFEFSILVEYNPNTKLPAVDKKIGITSASIFSDFYSKKGNAVSIYICDSSDGKQAIRKRKFDQWFSQYNSTDFLKIDETLIDINKKRFPIALILTKSNPYRTEIIDSFVNLVLFNNDNK